jgi:hypothetical protein
MHTLAVGDHVRFRRLQYGLPMTGVVTWVGAYSADLSTNYQYFHGGNIDSRIIFGVRINGKWKCLKHVSGAQYETMDGLDLPESLVDHLLNV